MNRNLANILDALIPAGFGLLACIFPRLFVMRGGALEKVNLVRKVGFVLLGISALYVLIVIFTK